MRPTRHNVLSRKMLAVLALCVVRLYIRRSVGLSCNFCHLLNRDVNEKDRDPMGPMGFSREWEYDQSWDGNRMEMAIRCVRMVLRR